MAGPVVHAVFILALQSRPLDVLYPVIYLDALVVKVRDDAHVTNKAADSLGPLLPGSRVGGSPLTTVTVSAWRLACPRQPLPAVDRRGEVYAGLVVREGAPEYQLKTQASSPPHDALLQEGMILASKDHGPTESAEQFGLLVWERMTGPVQHGEAGAWIVLEQLPGPVVRGRWVRG